MARARMVTRTIKTTVVDVLCMNIETQQPEQIKVTLPQTYDSQEKMLKQVIKRNTNEALKPVHIVNSTVVEDLYGMLEEEFIEIASKLENSK